MKTVVQGVDITTLGLRGSVALGKGNVLSVQAVVLRGDLTALSLDIFSANAPNIQPSGKTALANISSAAEMTADIPCDGFSHVIWSVTTAGTTGGSLVNLEFEVKQTVPA